MSKEDIDDFDIIVSGKGCIIAMPVQKGDPEPDVCLRISENDAVMDRYQDRTLVLRNLAEHARDMLCRTGEAFIVEVDEIAARHGLAMGYDLNAAIIREYPVPVIDLQQVEASSDMLV